MRLGEFAIDDCCGLLLAHRLNLGQHSFAKGTVLDEAILSKVKAAGITALICARPDADDLHEDVAADRLARAVSPDDVDFNRAATGRVNIRTRALGIIRYDRDFVRRLNEVDEAITFALVQHNQVLDAGQMAATLKIIPFFVTEKSVKAIETLLAGARAFSFHPLIGADVALIQTRLAGQKDRLFSATVAVTRDRLEQLGCRLLHSRICAHDRVAVAAQISACAAGGAKIILLCGGSAITDRQDELPQALVLAGGVIEQFGLAVDPGNLLMLGRLGSATSVGTYTDAPYVIGMPGCARSPKLNGLDWVLQLILAKQPLDRRELAQLAAGGLLMEIASRPMPRALVTRQLTPNRMAGILLAAGSSQRMGAANKLLQPINGKAMIRHVAEALVTGLNSKTDASEIVVVLGHEADKVAAALADLPVRMVFNPDHASGQGSSVATGAGALGADVTDGLICLGDMPLLDPSIFTMLADAHLDRSDHKRLITLPVFEGKRGNPVIWGQAFFADLSSLAGDAGGRQLLDDHQAAQNLVPCDSPAIIRDVDTAEALLEITKALSGTNH